MTRQLILLASSLFFSWSILFAQQPEDYGFRKGSFEFEGEQVEYLLRSKKGEENQKKPFILFIQGSLPKPLFIYNEQGDVYGVFPFDVGPYLDKYHFGIIGKPGIPISASVNDLQSDMTWLDPETGDYPETYCRLNNREYYIRRNKAFLDMVFFKEWVIQDIMVVMGHSEGVSIASGLATNSHRVTEMILFNGNPLGRTMSMLLEDRSRGGEQAPEIFKSFKGSIEAPKEIDCRKGDPNSTTVSFSQPFFEELLALEIRILVAYGAADPLVPGNDFLQVEAIRRQKKHLSFKVYEGLEHNFFATDAEGNPVYEDFNWDKVMAESMNWLF